MTELINNFSMLALVAAFALSAVTIGYFGIKMTYVARDLASLTGLGEAFFGAVFIGAATSLSGLMASTTAAWNGEASLAVSNSLGGIAAQTLFLVIADLVYRKANLEFAAASVENLMMSAQLTLLLCILLIAFNIPDSTIGHIHPATLVLIAAYLLTLKMLIDAHTRPMWLPRMTRGTMKENKKKHTRLIKHDTGELMLHFAICAAVVAISGWLIANIGIEITSRTGISTGVMGGIFIAITTSLPELVIAITAVRMGALTLAVGDIVGGNAFDTLFIAVSDLFYREGSIFNAITSQEKVWLSTALLMNSILLLGLMYRERKGVANIGLESTFILLVYILSVTYLGLQ